MTSIFTFTLTLNLVELNKVGLRCAGETGIE